MVKYIVDVIAIINKNKFTIMKKSLIKIHSTIEFTFELEEDGKITLWYRKEWASDMAFNFLSNHYFKYKYNVLHNMINRVIKLTTKMFTNRSREKWYHNDSYKKMWIQFYKTQIKLKVNKELQNNYFIETVI